MTTSHKEFKKGNQVTWKWGANKAKGKISEIYTEKVSKKINGKTVTRNATPEKPAYLLVQEDGQEVLKSQSSLSHA